jgi:hypothetical protein
MFDSGTPYCIGYPPARSMLIVSLVIPTVQRIRLCPLFLLE